MSKKSDFFSTLRDNTPVERELQYRGKTQSVHFRRLSAGERAQMMQGLAQGVAIDLGDMARRRHLLVRFMLVRPDGTNVYDSIETVQAEPEDLVDALYTLASDAFPKEEAAAASAEEVAGNS